MLRGLPPMDCCIRMANVNAAVAAMLLFATEPSQRVVSERAHRTDIWLITSQEEKENTNLSQIAFGHPVYQKEKTNVGSGPQEDRTMGMVAYVSVIVN